MASKNKFVLFILAIVSAMFLLNVVYARCPHFISFVLFAKMTLYLMLVFAVVCHSYNIVNCMQSSDLRNIATQVFVAALIPLLYVTVTDVSTLYDNRVTLYYYSNALSGKDFYSLGNKVVISKIDLSSNLMEFAKPHYNDNNPSNMVIVDKSTTYLLDVGQKVSVEDAKANIIYSLNNQLISLLLKVFGIYGFLLGFVKMLKTGLLCSKNSCSVIMTND